MAKVLKQLLTLSMAAAFTTAALAQNPPAKPEAAKTDKTKTLAALQGAWLFTMVDGQEMTNGPEIVVTITGDKYVQVTNGTVAERGSFTFDDTKQPMTMDLLIAEGAPDDVGKTQLGVFEVTATTMRGKLNNPGETVRPTDFAPAPDAGFFAFTAKKK